MEAFTPIQYKTTKIHRMEHTSDPWQKILMSSSYKIFHKIEIEKIIKMPRPYYSIHYIKRIKSALNLLSDFG